MTVFSLIKHSVPLGKKYRTMIATTCSDMIVDLFNKIKHDVCRNEYYMAIQYMARYAIDFEHAMTLLMPKLIEQLGTFNYLCYNMYHRERSNKKYTSTIRK